MAADSHLIMDLAGLDQDLAQPLRSLLPREWQQNDETNKTTPGVKEEIVQQQQQQQQQQPQQQRMVEERVPPLAQAETKHPGVTVATVPNADAADHKTESTAAAKTTAVVAAAGSGESAWNKLNALLCKSEEPHQHRPLVEVLQEQVPVWQNAYSCEVIATFAPSAPGAIENWIAWSKRAYGKNQQWHRQLSNVPNPGGIPCHTLRDMVRTLFECRLLLTKLVVNNQIVWFSLDD